MNLNPYIGKPSYFFIIILDITFLLIIFNSLVAQDSLMEYKFIMNHIQLIVEQIPRVLVVQRRAHRHKILLIVQVTEVEEVIVLIIVIIISDQVKILLMQEIN